MGFVTGGPGAVGLRAIGGAAGMRFVRHAEWVEVCGVELCVSCRPVVDSEGSVGRVAYYTMLVRSAGS